jgi:hypothetical protein
MHDVLLSLLNKHMIDPAAGGFMTWWGFQAWII